MSTITAATSGINLAASLDQMQELMDRSLTRLSSGTSATSPADNPVGLAQSSTFTGQNGRLQAASTNIQNALSYVQTSDGFMSGMSTVLSRLSQLATLAQDPTKSASDISLYQQEFTALQEQMRATIGGTTAEIGGTTGVASPLGTFNGVALFGSGGAGMTIDTGDTTGDVATIQQANLKSGAMLNVITEDNTGAYTLNLTTPNAVATLNSAIQQLATERANTGATEARLNVASASLQVQSQNLTSAISSITDTDVARESTQLAKYNILLQANTSMLVQANQTPKQVLQLLKQ